MDQDETWHGGCPRPRPHCVRWGPSPPPKKDTHPQFSAHVRCGETAGCIQDATWYGSRPRPRPHCVRQGPSSAAPPPQKGAQQSRTFRPMSIVAKRSPISATAELLFVLHDQHICIQNVHTNADTVALDRLHKLC